MDQCGVKDWDGDIGLVQQYFDFGVVKDQVVGVVCDQVCCDGFKYLVVFGLDDILVQFVIDDVMCCLVVVGFWDQDCKICVL